MPLLTALVTHRSPLLAFSKMVFAIFPASRVGSIILFRGLVASISSCLTIPFYLVILVLPLQLTSLLTLVPASTLLILFLPIFKHIVPHLFELVKVMFGPIRALNAVSGSDKLVSSTFNSQRDVRLKHL